MEELEEIKNTKVYGFYNPVGLDLEDSKMLQVIYFIDGKYYVMYQEEDLWSKVMFKIDLIFDMYKGNKEKMYYAISEFMSYFKESIPRHPKYQLYEIDINNVHNLIPYQEEKVVTCDDFKLDGSTFIGAIPLKNGCIAVGNEEFLEEVISHYIDDEKRRDELLEEIYYNFYEFEKRENVINDFFRTYYDSLDEWDRKIWDSKKANNYLVLYALSLLKDLNVGFKEINNNKLVDNIVRL